MSTRLAVVILILFACVSLSLFSAVAIAQTQLSTTGASEFTRIRGPHDNDIPVPTAILPQQDASALQVVESFLATTSGKNWLGLKGSGTLSYPNADKPAVLPTQLTFVDKEHFRLDITRSEGVHSARIRGDHGIVQDGTSFSHTLPTAAASGGLLTLVFLLDSSFANAQTGLSDRGIVEIGGSQLHRITFQDFSVAPQDCRTALPASPVDLYFDPGTHLLVKSVSNVLLSFTDQNSYLQTVTYSDYRMVGDSLVPFAFSEAINGQPQWSLQLTEAVLNPTIDTAYFQF